MLKVKADLKMHIKMSLEMSPAHCFLCPLFTNVPVSGIRKIDFSLTEPF